MWLRKSGTFQSPQMAGRPLSIHVIFLFVVVILFLSRIIFLYITHTHTHTLQYITYCSTCLIYYVVKM